jgi:hypothetical protein
VSCIPVVDEHGALIDIFARADITLLARHNTYNQLQHEDLPMASVLALTRPEAHLLAQSHPQLAANSKGGPGVTSPLSGHGSAASLGGLSQMLAGMGHGPGGAQGSQGALGGGYPGMPGHRSPHGLGVSAILIESSCLTFSFFRTAIWVGDFFYKSTPSYLFFID